MPKSSAMHCNAVYQIEMQCPYPACACTPCWLSPPVPVAAANFLKNIVNVKIYTFHSFLEEKMFKVQVWWKNWVPMTRICIAQCGKKVIDNKLEISVTKTSPKELEPEQLLHIPHIFVVHIRKQRWR